MWRAAHEGCDGRSRWRGGRYRARGVASSQPRGQLKLKNIRSRPRYYFDSNCTNTATMPSFNIVVLGGDGVGPEVIAEGIKVLKVIEKHTDVSFNFQEHLFGGCSIDAHNNPLTDETLEAAKKADAIILGAVGGPVGATRLELLQRTAGELT
ncbi:hypothetical protein B5807_07124 [Epicoccum nigrum]|uniref:Isopropylmalate dehydrogenase-like domain-containing protein n=1 Tax=Epicoccum nigrum TaxID=105696 RepID=A0A1Y2LXR6_EPING|nr:hypothetical protein B5807_07124 [Epicoccum nigrum]